MRVRRRERCVAAVRESGWEGRRSFGRPWRRRSPGCLLRRRGRRGEPCSCAYRWCASQASPQVSRLRARVLWRAVRVHEPHLRRGAACRVPGGRQACWIVTRQPQCGSEQAAFGGGQRRQRVRRRARGGRQRGTRLAWPVVQSHLPTCSTRCGTRQLARAAPLPFGEPRDGCRCLRRSWAAAEVCGCCQAVTASRPRARRVPQRLQRGGDAGARSASGLRAN